MHEQELRHWVASLIFMTSSIIYSLVIFTLDGVMSFVKGVEKVRSAVFLLF